MATSPERTSSGMLQIHVVNIQNNFPIQNANVTISYTGDPESPIEQLHTNSSGQTETISLPAPPVEYSLEPGILQPYSEYNVLIEVEGFRPLAVSGTEILAGTTALQPALTLGCGAVGGSATSDNVGPMNLINIRRVAYGLRELEDLRGTPGTCRGAEKKEACASNLSREEIEAITRAVLARLNAV